MPIFRKLIWTRVKLSIRLGGQETRSESAFRDRHPILDTVRIQVKTASRIGAAMDAFKTQVSLGHLFRVCESLSRNIQ